MYMCDMYNEQNDLKLHPLWAQEYWKIKAFFEPDESVLVSDVEEVNGEHFCTITVDDPKKGLYLAELIKTYELEVKIDDGLTNNEKIAYICKDNPMFHELVEVRDPDTDVVKYAACEFEPVCMHWFSDDFFSPTGHTAALPYQLAKDIFYHRGVNFQTHLEK